MRGNMVNLKKKLKTIRKGQKIEIKWIDHWSSSGWRPKDFVDSSLDMECTSVGYYCGENSKYIFLAATDDLGQDVGSATGRLKNCIISLRKLK